MGIAVYPGTFDPFTRGHEDIVRRAARIFPNLIVAIANSRNKKPIFTLEERLMMAQEALAPYPNVEVKGFSGLLTDFVKKNQAQVIVRGLRAFSDFEYEFQMAGTNRHLLPEIEMVFMMPTDHYQFISGSLVREIAQLGGDVSKFVQPCVEHWLKKKMQSLEGEHCAS